MTDILIRTKPDKIEHKYTDKCDKDEYCFWTMLRPPKQTLYAGSERDIDGRKIMFTDGKNVIGEGTIIEVTPTTSMGKFNKKSDDVTPGEIRFTPLKRVCYPQPKKAPTRGFTYVEGSVP
jgi:Fe-S-cluster formation regulator IscX/YfhJ